MHDPFGRYILLERIAIGGMAEIFKAKAPGLGGFEKVLAIKRLHPRYSQDADFIEMLIDEARITVELAHSNIGQIFDLGKVEDHYFIAMEFIDGRDLYRVMKRLKERRQVFPVDAAAFVAMEACAGLDYAHRKKDSRGRPLHIVHRDVSPQNVLVSFEGDVKMVDFGIAKAALRAYETESGIIKGKFYYMSPEQAKGEPLDHRTDIFSIGIVLYEMLTGDLLYKDDDDVTLLSRVRRAEIEPPSRLRPDVPRGLEQIVMRALARDREDRYPSAQHMQRDLARFLRGSDVVFNKTRLGQMMRELFLDEAPVEDHHSEAFLRERGDFVADRQSVISMGHFDDMEPTEVEDDQMDASVPTLDSGLYELDPDDLELVDEDEDEPTWNFDGAPAVHDAFDSIEVHGPPGGPDPGIFGDGQPTNALEVRRPAQRPTVDGRPARASARPLPQPVRVVADPVPLSERPTPVPQRVAPRPAPARSMPAPAVVARAPDDDGFQGQPTVIVPAEAPRDRSAALNAPRRGRRPGAVATPVGHPLHQLEGGRGRERLWMIGVLVAVIALAAVVTSLLIKEDAPPARPVALAPAVVDVRNPIEPPPTKTTGTLLISSDPSGAEVKVDGSVKYEATPTRVEVPAGKPVRVRVALARYKPHDTEVTLEPGQEMKVHAALQREGGTLTIESDPSGAQVHIDGKESGRSPLTVADLPLDRPVRVWVDKAGFERFEQAVEWGGERERTLKVELERQEDITEVAERKAEPTPRRRAARRDDRDREAERARRRAAERERAARRARAEADDRARRRARAERRRADPKPRARRRTARRGEGDRASGVGYLSVNSREWGAVFLNGNQIALETPLLKYRVQAGTHKVQVAYGGDRSRRSPVKRVTIAPGKVSIVKF